MGEIPKAIKIDIHPANVKAFADAAIDDRLQTFVNKLLEKYFAGNLVILTKENAEYISVLTGEEKFNEDIDTVVNRILSSIEVEVQVEKEKVKIPIKKNGNSGKVKISKRIGDNWVTRY